jgi:hypothetical protein
MSDSTIQILEGLGAGPLMIEEDGLASTISLRADPGIGGIDNYMLPVKYGLIAVAGLVGLTVLRRVLSQRAAPLAGLGARIEPVYVLRKGRQRRRKVGLTMTLTAREKKMAKRADKARTACARRGLKPGSKAYRSCFKRSVGQRRRAKR